MSYLHTASQWPHTPSIFELILTPNIRKAPFVYVPVVTHSGRLVSFTSFTTTVYGVADKGNFTVLPFGMFSTNPHCLIADSYPSHDIIAIAFAYGIFEAKFSFIVYISSIICERTCQCWRNRKSNRIVKCSISSIKVHSPLSNSQLRYIVMGIILLSRLSLRKYKFELYLGTCKPFDLLSSQLLVHFRPGQQRPQSRHNWKI